MIQNAKQLPAVYYGLHFAPGVAEYQEAGKDAYRIFINENAAKKMDPSFQGKPVYVDHVEEVNLPNLEREIDGVVFDSFYNKADGKHWVRFEVHTDRGHEAIRKGWKLSNAYVPKGTSSGGLWHGVEYREEVMDGEYEHLAIVQSPRYDESVILTPEEFKKYNESKEIELKKFANSKEEKPKMAFTLFKRTKVENSLDIENTMVALPLSKKEMSLGEVINGLDKVLNMHGYASDDHMVKINDSKEMSVKELRDCHNKMMMEEEERKKNAEMEVSEPVAGDDLGEAEDAKMRPKNEGEDDSKDMKVEPKKNAKPEAKGNFERLKNAPEKMQNETEIKPIFDGVKMGRKLFGSN